MNIEDVEFEMGPDMPNLASHTTAIIQARARGPDPVNQKRGKSSKRLGVTTERMARAMFEDAGFIVIKQGQRGQRDFLAERGGKRYSVEVKATRGRQTAASERKAFEQCLRQALPGTMPLALLRRSDGVNKSEWTVVCEDGALPWVAWKIALDGPIPQGTRQ